MTSTNRNTYFSSAGASHHETITAALLRRLADDLEVLLDCAWIIAWEERESELELVYRSAGAPDAAVCGAEVRRILNRADRPTHDYPAACDTTPVLVFPVRCLGQLAGAIAVGGRRHGEYSGTDAALMAESCKRIGDLLEEPVRAARLAGSVRAVERRRREMEAAREVQNRFFPARLPAIPGADCYGECRPSGEVGGDFFDLRATGPGKLALAIGDVSGKGVPAAIIMAGLQVALRGLSVRSLPPVRVVEELNRLVCAISPDNYFVSMFYAQLDVAAGAVTYVNAGHEPPLLMRRDGGRIERLADGGTVLGLSRKVRYAESVLAVESGDWLVAVTDGITEARAADGEYFEAARVTGAIDPAIVTHANQAVAAILDAVDTFATAPLDDRTAVAVRITSARREPAPQTCRVAAPLEESLAVAV